MPIFLKQSTASQEVPLGYFVDSTDGNTEETALTINNTDIKVWKTGATTLASKNSGGATHISNGVYYAVLDATDTDTLGSLVLFVHVTGALTVRVECVVLAANIYDSLIGGGDVLDVSMTQILGTAVSSPATAGILDVNVKNMNNVAATSITTINANQGTTQPVNFTGTGASALAKSDMVDVAGSAVSTASAQLGVNVVNAAGTAWGSGAITAASIATDAITAAKIAADAIGASELAADAVAEIQSGLSTYNGTDTSGVTTLLTRLSATRAGYLDNLSAGAVATAAKLLKYFQLALRKDSAIATDNSAEVTELNANGGSGAGAYANTTDAQEALRDRGDAAWITATGFSTLNAAAVENAVWDATIASHSTMGSAGKALQDAGAAGTPPTVAQIADGVWDELISGHAVSGSTGEALSAARGAGDPWITTLPGSYTSGQAGKIVGDYLNATVSSRATQTSVDTVAGYVDTEVAAIKAKTDQLTFTVANQIDANVLDWKSATAPAMTGDAYARLGTPAGVSVSADVAAVKAQTAAIEVDTGTDIPAAVAALHNLSAAQVNAEVDTALADAGVTTTVTGRIDAAISTRSTLTADQVWAYVVEGSYTALQFIRLITAALTGKLSGAATTTVTIRDASDTKARITATVDADGNRSSVTLDGS